MNKAPGQEGIAAFWAKLMYPHIMNDYWTLMYTMSGRFEAGTHIDKQGTERRADKRIEILKGTIKLLLGT